MLSSFYHEPPPPLSRHSIVLDIDETLVHSSPSLHEYYSLDLYSHYQYFDLQSRIYLLQTYSMSPSFRRLRTEPYVWGIMRPRVREFLSFCFRYFENVIIWSAGHRGYVLDVVDKLFLDLPYPHCIYTAEYCEVTGETFYKPLRKMIYYERDLNLNLETLFMIDDRKDNFLDNPENGILIPPYSPTPTLIDFMLDDRSLDKLIKWFSLPEVIQAPDIRLLDKSHIFE